MADDEESTQDRLKRERDEQIQRERSKKEKKAKYLENIIDRKNVEIYNIYIQLKMNIRIARKLSELSTDIDSDSLQVSIVYNDKKYIYEDKNTFDNHLKSINLLKDILIEEEEEEEEKDNKTQFEKDKNNKLLLPKYIYDNRDNPEFIEACINLMKHAPRYKKNISWGLFRIMSHAQNFYEESLYDELGKELAYTLDEDYENDKQNSYLEFQQKIENERAGEREKEKEKESEDEEFLGKEFVDKEFLGESDKKKFMELLSKQRKLFDEEKKELTDIKLVKDLKNKFRIVETLRSEKVIDITTLHLASRILRDVMKERDYRYLENPESKDRKLYNDLFYSTDLLSTELYKPYFFFDKKIYFFLVLKEPNTATYLSHINNIIKKFTKNEEGTVIEDDAELVKIYNANKISINKSIRYLIDNAPKSREGISLYDAINEAINPEKAAEAEAGAAAAAEAAAAEGGGKRKSKGKSKKVAKKPVVSQKKQSIYKEIFGKQMKIYKMPDSRKEYVKYKGELLHISDYKDLMKQKAIAKTKTKVTKATKVTKEMKATQQKVIAKTKTKETNVTKATQQKAIEKTKTKTKETKATQQKAKAKAKAKK